MPVYEYECGKCGLKFERRQAMTDIPVTECPECCGPVRLLVSGGVGVVSKGSGHGRTGLSGGGCSFEQEGTTCCGKNQRCGQSLCG
jgi:putative FmdB family regulatory protein